MPIKYSTCNKLQIATRLSNIRILENPPALQYQFMLELKLQTVSDSDKVIILL